MKRYPTLERKTEKQIEAKLLNLLEGNSMLKRFGFNKPSSGL